MMPDLVAEKAAGGSVAVATLFEFQFMSSTQRFWDGLRYLTTTDARRWQGAGKLISVSGLGQAANMSAAQVTFTLSGSTPELVAAALRAEAEVTNRPCAVYLQFLNGRYEPLDLPVAIWSGYMDSLSFKGSAGNQQLSLTAEGLFVERIRSPHGLLTDADQQARWPGDLGMSLMPTLRNKTTSTWLRS